MNHHSYHHNQHTSNFHSRDHSSFLHMECNLHSFHSPSNHIHHNNHHYHHSSHRIRSKGCFCMVMMSCIHIHNRSMECKHRSSMNHHSYHHNQHTSNFHSRDHSSFLHMECNLHSFHSPS